MPDPVNPVRQLQQFSGNQYYYDRSLPDRDAVQEQINNAIISGGGITNTLLITTPENPSDAMSCAFMLSNGNKLIVESDDNQLKYSLHEWDKAKNRHVISRIIDICENCSANNNSSIDDPCVYQSYNRKSLIQGIQHLFVCDVK